jgi:hypothetical protein
MSRPTDLFYKLSGVKHPLSYVETGCYKGANLERVISGNSYREIHSIELDPDWFEYNQNRFSHLENVFMHLGDSSVVLKKIDSPSPKTIFLDAHYSGPGTAFGKLETPLLDELAALNTSPLDDNTVIVIDDVRMLGFKGLMPGVHYHPFESDWTDITLERIKEIMGCRYSYVTNYSCWLTEGPEDQLVIFKTSKVRGFAMIWMSKWIKRFGWTLNPLPKSFKLASKKDITPRGERD